MAFLIDKYGLAKFKELYKTDYITWKLHTEEPFEEIYGKSISQLEEEWIGFLKNYAPGEGRRAKLFLRVSENRTGSKIYKQLGKVWRKSSFELIGFSPRACRLTHEMSCALVNLGNLSGPSLDQFIKTYREVSEETKRLLGVWLDAVKSYKSVKEKLSEEAGIYSNWLTSKLRRIKSLYLTAGDHYMADKISKQLNHVASAFAI